MTKQQAVLLITAKRFPGVTAEQLKRQKTKVCTAARKWRQSQPTGTAASIAETAGVTENAVFKFETGYFFSANILRAFFRAGFDPEPIKLIKALQSIGEGAE